MKYNLKDTDVLRNLIAELGNLPLNKFEVLIREKKRSLDQNALYHVWIAQISKDTGYTKDQLHYSFKKEFLGEELKKDIYGRPYLQPKSTTKLKKGEFSDFMEKVQIYAIQQGITLPTKAHYGW